MLPASRHAIRFAHDGGEVPVRARRQVGWVALLGAIAAAPAFAATPGPAPKIPPHRKYRPYIERSNSIPAPYALGSLGLATNLHAGLPPQGELSLGFAVGLTPHIWVDGSVGTLRWAPSLVFHSVQVGPNAVLVDTPSFELDAMAHVSGPADDGRLVEQIEPALYTVVHIGHALRVDGTLAFDVNPGPTTTFGVRLPAALSFQITNHVYASVSTGVTVGNLARASESTAIPAGLAFGWSDYLRPTGPQAIAISPSISFPEIWRPWAREPFRPGTLTVGLTFYYVWKY
jgi:hypothetical protein